LLLGFALAYLASASLQEWVPPLVPFVAAAAVEAQFLVAGLRTTRRGRTVVDRGPQQRDLEELGWTGSGPDESAAIDDVEGEVSLPAPPPAARRSSRARLRLLQALAILAVFAGVIFLDWRGAHWQRLSSSTRAATIAVLDRQASRIAGHPADVICDVSGRHVGYVQDADGLAELGGRRAWLTPSVCYRLYLVKRDGRARGAGSGQAIAVLAHEAWHLRGEANEGRVNCFAYQSGVQVGVALGLSRGSARQLMRQQLADNPSDFAGATQYIVPPGCHRGGSLDLHLDGDHFP
jgi:hypothetical protein